MRTTLDIDGSILERLREIAHREHATFRDVLNRTLVRGLAGVQTAERPYIVPSHAFGAVREGVDLTYALRLSTDLEDAEIANTLSRER